MQCSPKAPKCGECPLKVACVAFQEKQVDLLPVKQSKTKQKTSFLSYFHIQTPEGMVLYKRPLNGIWGGLHEFPVIETLIKPKRNELEIYLCETLKLPADYSNFLNVYNSKHVLSHRIFKCAFYYLELDSTVHLRKPFFLTAQPNNYSYSRLMEKYFEAVRNPQNSLDLF
jgi:A/G-specific adenine glycosylase